MKEYRYATDTVAITLERLEEILRVIPAQLKGIDDHAFSSRPAEGKWSPKEIIGHLIDSATNNHHRFVRCQFDENPRILYAQEAWVSNSYYQQMPGHHLIDFWVMYNRHLLELIRLFPEESLERTCAMGDGSLKNVRWLFEDYVRHLEHHVKQIETLVRMGDAGSK